MANQHDTCGITVREVPWATDSDTLLCIRTEVFVVEQEVPVDEETDGMDEDSYHFVAALRQGTPVGVARLLKSGQIGRMAVLKPYRNLGIGRRLLQCAVKKACSLELEEIFLHAQIHALDFYARNGFCAFGPEFDDAGIQHRAMKYVGSSGRMD